MGNTTCPVQTAPTDPQPFYSDGNINFKAHDVGWIICGFFSCIATGASVWLIWKHLTYYTCPQQQRHIIRMLLMVPIYAIISTLSYVFFSESIYYITICNCYEAVVITSFFNLLLQYVGDTPSEQLEVFRQVKLTKWFFPLGFWKYRPSGEHFLWLMKIFILQYSVLQPICTLIAVGLQYYGLYCLESWEPYFGHIWLSLTIAISITFAMYCIVQIYLPITEELKPYKPVLKFLAIKAIVFLTFWQDSFLSVLIYFNVIKETKYFTTGDIQVGINALLVTFEMMIFGFLHIKAFTYIIYRPIDKTRTTRRGRAMLDVIDFRDWWYDIKNTTRYVAARGRGKDFTIADDIRNQKYNHLEKALGRDRAEHLKSERELAKQNMPTFWKNDSHTAEDELLISANDVEGENGPQDERYFKGEGDREKEFSTKTFGTSETLARGGLPHLSYNVLSAGLAGRGTLCELTGDGNHQGNDVTNIEAQSDDFFAPCKGGRRRKEASLGLGAWWRTFRERVSGGSVEEMGQEKEGGYNEKTVMLVEELERGIASMAEERKRDEVCEDLMPPVRRDTDSSDVSDSVLRGRDSPLSSLIKEHKRKSNDKVETILSPKILTPSRQRQVAIISDNQMMARQGSKKAALDVEQQSTASRQVEPYSQITGLHEASSDNPTVSISTSEMQWRARLSSSNIQNPGPKGKSLILPQPLSNTSLPSTTPQLLLPVSRPSVNPQSISAVPTRATNDNLKILFVESNATRRKKAMEDDPEAEPVNRAGTVVVGGQSFSQMKAIKTQQEDRQRMEQQQSKRGEFDTINRWNSHVSQPGQQQQQQQQQQRLQPAATSSRPRTHLSREQQQQPSQPYISLPAPSQLAQMDHRQDPFAAASGLNHYSGMNDSSPLAELPSHLRNPHPQQKRHSSALVRGRDRPSLEVGSILYRQDVLEVSTLRPSLAYAQHPRQNIPARSSVHPRRSLHNESSVIPSHTPRNQQAPKTIRHSTGSHRHPPVMASYDRYSGEPSLTHNGQSTVASRRQHYEAPAGFYFDYLD